MKKSRDLLQLKAQLPEGELLLDPETCALYSGDKWFATALPEAVAIPSKAETVAAILAFATKRGIPVTARGAGYGYVGGCVPVRGGIVLSLEKLDRILEINRDDFVAVVQPAVKTAALQSAVEKQQRHYPPDPASRADCSIGGNIATNAGGPRCLKYGVTREYVLGLQVALATGELIRVGSRTHKNKSGFDLPKVFVGSEGLLGVITEATLKLLPLPPFRACLALGFSSMRGALKAIKTIFNTGLLPSALEVADAFTLAAAYKRTGSKMLLGCKGHLIVELDGQENSVRSEITMLVAALQAAKPLFIQRAFGVVDCESIWQVRREFSYSLRDTGLTKLNEDIVVPRGQLEALFRFTEQLQKTHGFPVACFGHAGDGNIHVNIMVDRTAADCEERCGAALDALFKGVLALGGVITGEHGIGIAKKPWWPLAATAEVQAVHRRLKMALDPEMILNPGKFV